MLENQFIQFSESIDNDSCSMAVPTKHSEETRFLVEDSINHKIDIVSIDGDIIQENAATIEGNQVALADISAVKDQECYRLKKTSTYINEEHDEEDFEIGSDLIVVNRIQSRDIIETNAGKDGEVTIKGYRAVTWGSNGAPYAVFTTIRAENIYGSEIYDEVTCDSSNSAGEDIVLRCSNSTYIRVYYRFDTAPSTMRALTISHKGIVVNSTAVTYSNVLKCDNTSQYSVVKYLCNEQAFGLPFDGNAYIQQVLPINIYSPQFKQSDKVYETLSGDQIVLFASVNREYEGETDYIPEAWHKKILIALSCDKVYINGEKVTKSGNYDIDWDKYDTACDGSKIVRATFKVTDNIIQRNSN